MRHTIVEPKYLVCYLATGNGVTVLSEHDLRFEAFDEIQSRDFKHSSLEGVPLYIIEATKIEVKKD